MVEGNRKKEEEEREGQKINAYVSLAFWYVDFCTDRNVIVHLMGCQES